MTAAVANYEELRRVAESAAGYVKRGKPWVSFSEMVQQAWVSILESQRTWRPDGAPFPAYAWMAAVQGCRKASSKAFRRYVNEVLVEVEEDLLYQEPEEESALQVAQWRDAIKTEVRKVLSECDAPAEVIQIALGTASAAELAEEKGLPSRKIYNESWKLRRRLKANPELQRLWKDKP